MRTRYEQAANKHLCEDACSQPITSLSQWPVGSPAQAPRLLRVGRLPTIIFHSGTFKPNLKMNRPDKDSVISVAIGQKPPPSEQKLKQLEHARKLAVESRKIRQRARLEAKLAQLRSLGDVSNEHLERVCHLLVETEKEGRKRTNTFVEDINTNMEDMNQEILAIRHMLQRVIDGRSTTPTRQQAAAPAAPRTPPAHPPTQRRPESTVSSSSGVYHRDHGVYLMN